MVHGANFCGGRARACRTETFNNNTLKLDSIASTLIRGYSFSNGCKNYANRLSKDNCKSGNGGNGCKKTVCVHCDSGIALGSDAVGND